MSRTSSLLLLSALAFAVPALAEEQAAPAADELSGAGKVIDVSPDGTGTVVKGEQAASEPAPKKKEGGISLADSCRARLAAQCKTLKRCLGDSAGMPLPCEGMGSLCGELQGDAPYTRKQLEACAKGLGALRCQNNLDPADPASFQLEARVPACKPILQAEAAQGGGSGDKGLGKIDEHRAAELQRQLNEALGGGN